MQSRIVSKFGGTSMGDAQCMLRAAEIAIKQNSFMVVVSATSGTTNQLIELSSMALHGPWSEVEDRWLIMARRHFQIAEELGAPTAKAEIELLMNELKSILKGISLLGECSARASDAVQSFGELMSSKLFRSALEVCLQKSSAKKNAVWWDARQILMTDGHFGRARPLNDLIAQKVSTKLKELVGNVVLVTQGFIGGTSAGAVTTLGRGGSDYSAAIFAEALQADVLEIWTDVPGVATTDPRLVSESKIIPEISFKEASELATFGAKVLHPATLEPAIRKNIPVFVASSFDPAAGGTWIRQSADSAPLIRAIALRKKQVLLTLSTPQMLHSHGFLFQIFKVFNDNKISVDAITTSEISVSLTLDQPALINNNLLEQLRTFAEVHVEDNLALVSLIGNNINHTPGLAKSIFDLIPDINVRMICLGASKHNFCFLVSEPHAALAVQKLHKGFQLEQ